MTLSCRLRVSPCRRYQRLRAASKRKKAQAAEAASASAREPRSAVVAPAASENVDKQSFSAGGHRDLVHVSGVQPLQRNDEQMEVQDL